MIARLDTTPVEQSTAAPPPELIHWFCRKCQEAAEIGSHVWSFCGTRVVTVGSMSGRRCPSRHQVCAVCDELNQLPCPKCVARHG